MTTAGGRPRPIPHWLLRLSPFVELIGSTVILLCIVFYRLFANPYAYFSADHSELYFPWWVFINRSIHSGEFPLLNRFWFAGSLPFAAIETGVFYPPTILLQLFFDARHGLDAAYAFFLGSLFFHYLLASVAFYLLMTIGLRLRRFPALFGSLVFCCSGSFIGRFVHPLLLVNLAWVPLVYLFFLLFLRHKKLIYALAASVVLALIVAAGHPQMVYYTFLVFGFTALCASLAERTDRGLVFAFSMLIMVVGVLLVAQKVLLGLELAGNIVRAGGEAETSESLFNSLHPLYYLTLLAPYLYGRHQIGYWGSQYPWGNWENFLYIGLLPILCLPFCVFWRNRRILVILASGLGLSVLISLGRYSALSAFLNRHLPLAESLGYLSKITVLIHFFVVTLATIGFQELCETSRRKRIVGLALGAGVFVLLFLVLRAGTVGNLRPAGLPPPSEAARDFAVGSVRLARFLFLLSAGLVGLPLLLGRRRALGFVLPIYALDLLLTVANFNPIENTGGRPSVRLSTSPVVERILQDPGVYRVNNLNPPNASMVVGIESTYGYHTVMTRAYSRIAGSLGAEYTGLLNLLNVRYNVHPGDLEPFGLEPSGEGLWRSPATLPRVSFIPAFQTVPNEDEMRHRVLNRLFDPHRAVLFESSVRLPPGFRAPAQARNGPGETAVRILKYSSTQVGATVDAPSPGFLLFSELQYPGWGATVDGAPAELLPADLSFYALPIGAGPHRVEFRFRSKPLRAGLWIAGLTAAAALLLLILPRTRAFFLRPFPDWNAPPRRVNGRSTRPTGA